MGRPWLPPSRLVRHGHHNDAKVSALSCGEILSTRASRCCAINVIIRIRGAGLMLMRRGVTGGEDNLTEQEGQRGGTPNGPRRDCGGCVGLGRGAWQQKPPTLPESPNHRFSSRNHQFIDLRFTLFHVCSRVVMRITPGGRTRTERGRRCHLPRMTPRCPLTTPSPRASSRRSVGSCSNGGP